MLFTHYSRQAGFPVAFCFTASMLLSALLLFFIQPVFSKMALPLLGGSAGVWNTAMVFFQAVLLGGYLYAHLLSRYFSFRTQILLHALIMTATLFLLPISLPPGWETPPSGMPMFWLLGLFGTALGVPFFVLSANAPLLQKWFSYTNHKSSTDPYFLYAASNAGSLFSLLSYPILVEPFFKLSTQSHIWAGGFIALFVMILGLSLFAQKFSACDHTVPPITANSGKPVNWLRRFTWVGYAILPSSLMLGVTTHLTTNVASAPFLWVLPLALYLCTFIIAFSPRPFLPFWLIEKVFPFAAIAGLVLSSIHLTNFLVDISGNLLCFYIIAQMCHNRLSADRPPAERLTEFYFFMSLGGVIGGALTALVAPLVFNDTHEYHVMIAVSGLVVLKTLPKPKEIGHELLRSGGIFIIIGAWLLFAKSMSPFLQKLLMVGSVTVLFTEIIFSRARPIRLFTCLSVAALLLANIGMFIPSNDKKILFKERSFFGIVKVFFDMTENGPAHVLSHGNTIHNIQLRSPEALDYPLAYYAPEGAFGQAVEAVRMVTPSPSVAVIGLGAGAMACHANDNEIWKFYEIDPMVVKVAQTQELFTYMNNCAPTSPIITGDARLTLQKEPAAHFDLIIVDAFSSNVIPAHLITLDALHLYRSKLKPGGVVFFHTSNIYLDVTSVILNTAKAANLATRFITTKPSERHKYAAQIHAVTAVIVGENDALLDQMLASYPAWQKRDGKRSVGVWRDDFSHVLGALLAKSKEDFTP